MWKYLSAKQYNYLHNPLMFACSTQPSTWRSQYQGVCDSTTQTVTGRSLPQIPNRQETSLDKGGEKVAHAPPPSPTPLCCPGLRPEPHCGCTGQLPGVNVCNCDLSKTPKVTSQVKLAWLKRFVGFYRYGWNQWLWCHVSIIVYSLWQQEQLMKEALESCWMWHNIWTRCHVHYGHS